MASTAPPLPNIRSPSTLGSMKPATVSMWPQSRTLGLPPEPASAMTLPVASTRTWLYPASLASLSTTLATPSSLPLGE
ncbi:hypothetical protein [Thermogymnomonas acidicola]|uniref:hypothetical protein n=1 Tax=Thermogymnomonas acidicola TaxID=399579 RepID=UPI0013969A23|nr:hypothetical protein [Thermogymnomonas acidicola]